MLLSLLDFEDARPEQLSDPSHRLLQLRVADVQFDSPSSVNLLSQPLDSPRLGIYVANLGLTLWPPGVNHDQDGYSSSSSRSEIYRLRKSPGCHPFYSAWPTDGSGWWKMLEVNQRILWEIHLILSNISILSTSKASIDGKCFLSIVTVITNVYFDILKSICEGRCEVLWRLGSPSRELDLPRPTPHHSPYQLQLLLQEACCWSQNFRQMLLINSQGLPLGVSAWDRQLCRLTLGPGVPCHLSASDSDFFALLQPSNTTPQ
jgi:hypothetical protein